MIAVFLKSCEVTQWMHAFALILTLPADMLHTLSLPSTLNTAPEARGPRYHKSNAIEKSKKQ